MKKTSIAFKIFVFTAGFFIIYSSLSLILQSLFVQKFYLYEKTKTFDKNFKIFSDSYSKLSPESQDTSKYLYEFEINNNANIVIINLMDEYNITYRGKKESLQSGSLPSNDAKRLGIIGPAINEWLSNSDYYNKVVKNGNTITYTSSIKFKELNSIIGVSPIVRDGKIENVLLSVTSLQPIGEAAAVIKKFYIYFYLLAIILILIFSKLFSNTISKPLIVLNRAALRMAELDFSVKCDNDRTDEIGNLSRTLNFLSSNLDSALTELQNANEKLTKDIEKEKSLDKMRKEFVADVSHELKTPISIIGGYAEALKDNILQGEERDSLLDVILDESEKMSLLVSDMLNLSQLESGYYKLTLEDFSLTSLVKLILLRHSMNINKNELHIKTEFYEENIVVLGDRLRIDQVITNLLNNAVKHTPIKGTIIISIAQAEESHQVIFSIENNGDPIEYVELENIWNKFYKIDKSRHRSNGGTGLGLSIVSNILELHHSRYGVENTENGVNFYFQLKKLSS